MTQLVNLSVTGLSCEKCVDAVNNALMSIDGVISAQTILEEAGVNIEYQDNKVDFNQFREVIKNAGYGVVE